MFTRRVIAVTAVAAALSTGAFVAVASADDDDEADFDAELDGAEEAPGPGDPDGSAEAEVEIAAEAGDVCFEVDWEGIASPMAGHIHEGPPGVAGPIVVTLFDASIADELELDDDHDDCVTADPSVLGRIVADPGNYYVNLHNGRFPNGAVRGVLQPD